MLKAIRSSEAQLRFMPNGFRVMAPGDHVRCAMSGEAIPLDALRYWSVELQQPYASCALAVQAITGRRPATSAERAA